MCTGVCTGVALRAVINPSTQPSPARSGPTHIRKLSQNTTRVMHGLLLSSSAVVSVGVFYVGPR